MPLPPRANLTTNTGNHAIVAGECWVAKPKVKGSNTDAFARKFANTHLGSKRGGGHVALSLFLSLSLSFFRLFDFRRKCSRMVLDPTRASFMKPRHVCLWRESVCAYVREREREREIVCVCERERDHSPISMLPYLCACTPPAGEER
jgi:hypothetical protein